MSIQAVQPHNPAASKSPFFQQREALVKDIAVSFEHVLQDINKLNRSLEGVIAVGNEFGAVEALWSQFEGVMAQEPEDGEEKEGKEGDENAEEEDQDGRRDRDENDGERAHERPQSKGRSNG